MSVALLFGGGAWVYVTALERMVSQEAVSTIRWAFRMTDSIKAIVGLTSGSLSLLDTVMSVLYIPYISYRLHRERKYYDLTRSDQSQRRVC